LVAKSELQNKKESVSTMSNSTKYIGLDVSKSKIAVAIAEKGRQEPRYWGTIPHTKEVVRKLMQQLRNTEEIELETCYEAGPTGYVLYRWLLEMAISCIVVAPSLIPKRAGDRDPQVKMWMPTP